jgi:hypothetical protein
LDEYWNCEKALKLLLWHYNRCSFLSFFFLGQQKKIPLQQGAKDFCGNNAQKSSDFEGKKILELPYLDNGFQALTGCQNMRTFLKVLYFPLWPVAKFG